ncbi:conserved protein of unknown function (plasmid) [Rhodovastum atsumiense]|uniref:Uncharacterized protein n=1 Tax=Rhodovastum atsumiense TaxID=504468 RepID=A0A5M6IHR4_9PROT|nr:hypothetical protein [Rhodovastum atsumiense]KAA5607821.1 hypothetical protein F1189_31900 [Rhodovastum atsumiense]CAH2605961.1 conserved protein of unknown function [Rhodovastum atsumiense]
MFTLFARSFHVVFAGGVTENTGPLIADLLPNAFVSRNAVPAMADREVKRRAGSARSPFKGPR